MLYSWLCNQIYIGGNPGLTTFRGSYSEIIENISITVQALLCNMGISGNVSLFSFQGIANVLRIILTGAIWIVFPFLSFKNIKNEPQHIRIFLVFSMLHIAEVLILLLFCDSVNYIANARYQLTALVLLSTISSHYIYERFVRKDCLSSWVYSILLAVISLVLAIPVANVSGWKDGLSDMQGVTDYLSENGLQYGYATFWNAEKNTVLSNGEVQINPVFLGVKSAAPYLSLASEDWYDPEYFKGSTFLMLTEDEAAAFAPDGYNYTNLWTPETVLNYSPYTILVYDHNISRNNFNDMLSGEANLLERAACSDAAMRQKNGDVLIREGEIMYGPYIPLNAGEYLLTVDVSLVSPVEIVVSAADVGGEVLETYKLASGVNEFRLKLEEHHSQIEFVVRNQTEQTIHMKGIYLLLKDYGNGV